MASRPPKSRIIGIAVACWAALLAPTAPAEDIDIYASAFTSSTTAGQPNVLIILDNTSNWSQQAQHWPGGIAQGQAEVDAIKTVISGLTTNINVGLMMYGTGSGGGNDGGYIRQAVTAMTDANKSTFSTKLETIYNNISSTDEKTSSSKAYGDILFDAFKYFGGYTSPAHASDGIAGSPLDSTHFGPACYLAASKVPTSLADATGYSTQWTSFSSPITASNTCGKNYIIFIGNGFPNSDSTTLLSNVGGDTSQLTMPNIASTTTTTTTTLGTTTSCFSSASACDSGGGKAEFSSACSSYDSCACSTAVDNTTVSCSGSDLIYTLNGHKNAKSVRVGYDSSCVNNVSACKTTDFASTCTTTYGGNCACNSSDYVTTGCSGSKKKYAVYGTQSASDTDLGKTTACYSSQAACNTANTSTCGSTYDTCTCTTPTTNSYVSCGGSTTNKRFTVQGSISTTALTADGSYATPSSSTQRSADEWTRFLNLTDINSADGQQNVSTYAIDVYYAKQDADQTKLLMNMARVGGGRYFAATSKDAIVNALNEIFAEILSVNSTFASASLPVSATNRARNENQVFIPMFRPDQFLKPRWYGNLKRYQLANFSSGVDLADSVGSEATNSQTGFVADCAVSWWTSDSPVTSPDYYWANRGVTPTPSSNCTTVTDAYQKFSDSPDGPFVEKGGAAEVLRKGNNPPTTDTTPTWAVNRNLYTLSGSSLVTFNSTNVTSIAADIVNFARGQDVADEYLNANTTEVRDSIHGDVIHSRPLPVNYGSAINVYYGANDGWLRAVDSSNGKEKWAFMAPEFFTRLERQKLNCPKVLYAGQTGTPTETCNGVETAYRARDYFWDGSIGLYQDSDNNPTWIYPTMRRGGRMIYALDVTSDTTPSFKWSAGCPNLTNDTGCTSGLSDIGQTWSMPNAAFVKGYSTSTPIVTIGGGYDTCEDADTASPSCSSPKGNHVYIFDGNDGTLLPTADKFETTRSVVGDVTYVDVDKDGYVDFAYAADTGGNLYRIKFINPSSAAALDKADWEITRIAYTNGSHRKFLYGPSALTMSKDGAYYVYLAIGSGDREHPLNSSYPYTTPVTNRFYVFLDKVTQTDSVDLDSTSGDVMRNCTTASNCSSNPLVPGSDHRGWFIDLTANGTGEQVVTGSLIVSGQVTFSTNRPFAPSAIQCTNLLGEARGYWLNLQTSCGGIGADTENCAGSRSTVFQGSGGLPPSPVIGKVIIDGKDNTILIGAPQPEGSGCAICGQKAPTSVKGKRQSLYWYQKGTD